MDVNWDLIVAGGGPAGCALAAKVASTGARVLLLEKEDEPGRGLSWIVDVESTAFEAAGVPFPGDDACRPEPERAVLVSPVSGREVDLIPSPTTPIRNDIYVRQLARWARDSGAEIRTGRGVRGPLLEGDVVAGVNFTDADGTNRNVSAPIVADCTGLVGAVRHGTPSAWGLNMDVDFFDIVVARRDVRRLDVEAAARAVQERLIENRVQVQGVSVHGGYSVEIYYMDLDQGYIDILIGAKPGPGIPTPDASFEKIFKRFPFIGEKIFGDGGAIPIRRTWDSLVGDGFLVVGDSACQVIPMHGSGTASALIAADLASKTISRALAEKRYDRAALWDYCYSFQSGRGALLAYYYALRLHADDMTSEDIDRMIRRGVLAAEDVHSGLVPEPFDPGPGILVKKFLKGILVLPLLFGFAKAGLRAEKLMKHYQRYPARYSPEELRSWVSRLPV